MAIDTPPAPDLGRSVRIVGPVKNVDPKQMPHPMNQRGELGKALYNWRHNTISNDPVTRIVFENHCADRAHVLNSAMRPIPKGKSNPDRVAVPDPQEMSRHIKRVAKYLGLDVVGIGRSHPSFLYAGKSVDGISGSDGEAIAGAEELAKAFPYVIAGSVAWDHDMTQAHRHRIGDAAYDFTGQQTNMIMAALEGYINELGYNTLRGAMNGQAAALAAGVGELGRNGLIITEKFGARVTCRDPIMTDLRWLPTSRWTSASRLLQNLPQVRHHLPDELASRFDDKVVDNGVEKYKINWLTCYKLRPYVAEHWVNCLTCVTVCPYTKPNTWWHALA